MIEARREAGFCGSDPFAVLATKRPGQICDLSVGIFPPGSEWQEMGIVRGIAQQIESSLDPGRCRVFDGGMIGAHQGCNDFGRRAGGPDPDRFHRGLSDSIAKQRQEQAGKRKFQRQIRLSFVSRAQAQIPCQPFARVACDRRVLPSIRKETARAAKRPVQAEHGVAQFHSFAGPAKIVLSGRHGIADDRKPKRVQRLHCKRRAAATRSDHDGDGHAIVSSSRIRFSSDR